MQIITPIGSDPPCPKQVIFWSEVFHDFTSNFDCLVWIELWPCVWLEDDLHLPYLAASVRSGVQPNLFSVGLVDNVDCAVHFVSFLSFHVDIT